MAEKHVKPRNLWKEILKNKACYVMLAPFMILFIVFTVVPEISMNMNLSDVGPSLTVTATNDGRVDAYELGYFQKIFINGEMPTNE